MPEIVDKKLRLTSIGVSSRTDERLLLLENCERSLEACGAFLVQLLVRYPDLRVVTTSREPWRLSGEVVEASYRPGVFDGVLGLALCAARVNSFERALRLLAAAKDRHTTVLRLFPGWREQLSDAYGIATRILPKSRAEAALHAGWDLDVGHCVAFVRDDDVPPAPAGEDDVLTPREWQVLYLVMEGLANSQIAHQMRLSIRTVETHIRNIRTVLGLRSRAHMAAWAARRVPNVL